MFGIVKCQNSKSQKLTSGDLTFDPKLPDLNFWLFEVLAIWEQIARSRTHSGREKVRDLAK
jgi:hypothetical protein